MSFWTPVRVCGAVSLFCGAWNLYGDLCFMDFYFAHMTFEDFGAIDVVTRPGRLFDFENADGSCLRLAQAGGWAYPVWALATSYPLFVGLRREHPAPVLLLAYGLCVVGGALHSGFTFATILPRTLSSSSEACLDFARTAQKEVMESYAFGYAPGPAAIAVASVWIARLVWTRGDDTMFPKWFVLFTPLPTLAWVVVVGLSLLPEPWGAYFVGTFGTWIVLVMNVATTYVLWNATDEHEGERSRHRKTN